MKDIVEQYCLSHGPNGGTDFKIALEAGKELIKSKDEKCIIIFLTDGECYDNRCIELTQEMTDYYDNLEMIFIKFGDDKCNFDTLDNMALNANTEVIKSFDGVKLDSTFTALANAFVDNEIGLIQKKIVKNDDD